MRIQLNQDVMKMVDGKGYVFNSVDIDCEKCGSKEFKMKSQKSVFGRVCAVYCNKCGHWIH